LIDRKTVFVLGAGGSCPYGYPSGAHLRKRICLFQGLWQSYNASGIPNELAQKEKSRLKEIKEFIDKFNKSRIKSIDLFIANNPKLAPIGKYIIAFEIFKAEQNSHFGEEAKFEQEQIADTQRRGIRGPSDLLSLPLFMGEDWYSFLYNHLIEGKVGKDDLPDFSDGNLGFITFNYDRSLEQFLYEALRYSFTEVPEERVVQCLKQLKILHVYGQTVPLKWQNPDDYVDYKQKPSESLLQRAANNIKTIYEEKVNPELMEAQNLIKQSEQMFFLGFGYASENMEVLGLPSIIPQRCLVYGTAFGANDKEVKRIHKRIIDGDTTDSKAARRKVIESTDCLELLRNYLG